MWSKFTISCQTSVSKVKNRPSGLIPVCFLFLFGFHCGSSLCREAWIKLNLNGCVEIFPLRFYWGKYVFQVSLSLFIPPSEVPLFISSSLYVSGRLQSSLSPPVIWGPGVRSASSPAASDRRLYPDERESETSSSLRDGFDSLGRICDEWRVKANVWW